MFFACACALAFIVVVSADYPYTTVPNKVDQLFRAQGFRFVSFLLLSAHAEIAR